MMTVDDKGGGGGKICKNFYEHICERPLTLRDKIVYGCYKERTFLSYPAYLKIFAIQTDIMSILPKYIKKYPNVLDSSLLVIYIYI